MPASSVRLLTRSLGSRLSYSFFSKVSAQNKFCWLGHRHAPFKEIGWKGKIQQDAIEKLHHACEDYLTLAFERSKIIHDHVAPKRETTMVQDFQLAVALTK